MKNSRETANYLEAIVAERQHHRTVHSNIDRLLIAISTGGIELDTLSERVGLSSGSILRCAAVLEEEKLIERDGIGQRARITYYPTEDGKKAARHVKKGGKRSEWKEHEQ